jgi:hypothetical protein
MRVKTAKATSAAPPRRLRGSFVVHGAEANAFVSCAFVDAVIEMRKGVR